MAKGEPHKALGISRRATPEEIQKAHVRLLKRFRGRSDVVLALNRAEAMLRPEPKPKVSIWRRFDRYSKKRLASVAGLSLSWPIRLLAIAGTALVLWQLHNILLIVIVMVLAVLYTIGLRKGNSASLAFAGFELVLVFCGFSASVYLALGKLVPIWQLARMTLSVIAGSALTWYIGVPFMRTKAQSLYKPNLWKGVGIFCVLFMLTFGVANLLLLRVPVTEPGLSASYFKDQFRDLTDKVHDFVQQKPAIPQSSSPQAPLPEAPREVVKPPGGVLGVASFVGKTLLFYVLTMILATLYFGSKWIQKLDSLSESRFWAGAAAIILSSMMALEFIFYVPLIGKYVGGAWGVVREVSEPLTIHFGGFLLYYGLSYALAMPVYLITVGGVKGAFRRPVLPFLVRILVGFYSIWAATAVINWAISARGLQAPAKAGFAAFLSSIVSLVGP